MENNKYDIGIIGGGIAGLVAAATALEAGYRTILFESNIIGGKTFNGGDLYLNQFVQAIKTNSNQDVISLHKLFEQTERIKKQYIIQLFPFLNYHENFTLINHKAEILDANTIKSNNEKYKCRYIIIATGNKANKVDIDGIDNSLKQNITLYATDFNKLSNKAKKVAILGGGRIAFELALLLVDFGIKATVISRGNSLSH